MRSSSVSPDGRVAGALALAVGLVPGEASGHSAIPGIEGFYAGLLHPLASPAQLLALIALGLLFGQRWPRQFGVAWVLFSGACIGGIVLGQSGVDIASAESSLLALALTAGVVGALWPADPARLGIAAAGLGGFLVGLDSTPDPGPLRATVITLAGAFVGATVGLLYAAGGLGWLHERATLPWARVGFRVAAAWIAAIAALLLALALVRPD